MNIVIYEVRKKISKKRIKFTSITNCLNEFFIYDGDVCKEAETNLKVFLVQQSNVNK